MIHAGPILKDMLRSKPFGNIVADLDQLVALYPSHQKDLAFGRFYENTRVAGKYKPVMDNY